MMIAKKLQQCIRWYFSNVEKHDDRYQSEQSIRFDQEEKKEEQLESDENSRCKEENILIDLKRDIKNQSIEELQNLLLKEIYGDYWHLLSIPNICTQFSELHIDENKNRISYSNMDQVSAIF